MRLLCPAKINLHLRVGPRRDDGFHSLLSWFCSAGLFDTLMLDCAPGNEKPAGGEWLSLSSDEPSLPIDRRNLVVKIGDAFAVDSLPIREARVSRIHARLLKAIPAGAGLGGGSSDGARALIGLDRLWNTHRAADYLSGFAARFGSDLPFFFSGPSSVCRGRGEIVGPIARPRAKWALLMLPPIHMPTAEVYRCFDSMRLGREKNIEDAPDWNAWSKLDAGSLLDRLVNDLEMPAFRLSPALAELRSEIECNLGRPVRMSGSGSSLFTLFDEHPEAARAQQLVIDRAKIRVECVELAPAFVDDSTTPGATGRSEHVGIVSR